MHLTREEHLLEIVVRPVGIWLVLVLAVRVMVFFQLVLRTLESHQTRTCYGLSAVLARDKAVDRNSSVLYHNIVGMIGIGLSEISLEELHVLHILNTERDLLHTIGYRCGIGVESEMEGCHI